MNTIGQILKSARLKKRYSLRHLEEVTKIKSGFIEAIEKQKWDGLPAFPTVLGFVKSLSTTLTVDEDLAVAVLKRDYPPRKLNINPKPDVSSKITWSPKLTFLAGIGAVLVIILGYLGLQYYRFVSPPALSVESPKENQLVAGENVLVFGSTDSDAKVMVNNQPAIVDENGKFSVDIGVSPQTKEIVITAAGRSGKSTTIRRKILIE